MATRFGIEDLRIASEAFIADAMMTDPSTDTAITCLSIADQVGFTRLAKQSHGILGRSAEIFGHIDREEFHAISI